MLVYLRNYSLHLFVELCFADTIRSDPLHAGRCCVCTSACKCVSACAAGGGPFSADGLLLRVWHTLEGPRPNSLQFTRCMYLCSHNTHTRIRSASNGKPVSDQLRFFCIFDFGDGVGEAYLTLSISENRVKYNPSEHTDTVKYD